MSQERTLNMLEMPLDIMCKSRKPLKTIYLFGRKSYSSNSYKVKISFSYIYFKWLLLLMGADEFKNYNLIQYGTVNEYHILIQISFMSH